MNDTEIRPSGIVCLTSRSPSSSVIWFTVVAGKPDLHSLAVNERWWI